MKLFLDEMLIGSKEYYESLGWAVTTVQDEKLKASKDREIVEYANAHDLILVTRDELPYNISKLIGAKCFRITDAMIAEMTSIKISESELVYK